MIINVADASAMVIAGRLPWRAWPRGRPAWPAWWCRNG